MRSRRTLTHCKLHSSAQTPGRMLRVPVWLVLLLTAFLPLSKNASAAIPGRAQIDVTGYVIHLDLNPASGTLTATAQVTFTALDDLDSAVFGLNNGLQITALTDASGAALAPQRNAADSTVNVPLATQMAKLNGGCL